MSCWVYASSLNGIVYTPTDVFISNITSGLVGSSEVRIVGTPTR